MPSCENCKYKWSWLDTIKIGFKGVKKCTSCGKRQYISQKPGNVYYYIYFFLLITLLSSLPLFDLSYLVSIFIATLFIIGMIAFIPYTIKLSNEQEPLW